MPDHDWHLPHTVDDNLVVTQCPEACPGWPDWKQVARADEPSDGDGGLIPPMALTISPAEIQHQERLARESYVLSVQRGHMRRN